MRALYDLPAPAKLNLFLHVVGRRQDGYHLIQSVFLLIDWCDTLSFELRGDGAVHRHDLGLPLPDDDLCLRAARALQAASGCPLGVDILIDKQVPWGAGLGGGSSDAATTLIALNRLWNLNWPRESLQRLAQSLGADVPFFVGGHNAWVEGIGERLTPLPVGTLGADPGDANWAIFKPNCNIPTSVIFNSPHLVRDTKAATLADFLAAARNGWRAAQNFGHNDLQIPAMVFSSEVAEAVALISDRYGWGRMTGSGSAVFAYAGSETESIREPCLVDCSIEHLPGGWSGRLCRGLPSHPLLGWVRDS